MLIKKKSKKPLLYHSLTIFKTPPHRFSRYLLFSFFVSNLQMDGGVGEVREELVRRLSDRFFAAVLVDIFTRCCRRKAGLDDKDQAKTGHVAFYWAAEFNLLAHLCFVAVMVEILLVPVVVARMRRIQPESDAKLVLGFIFLSISFSFLAYLRWFVVA